MKTKKFKIGIAGCGIIADIQAQAIQKSSNSELYSLFSRTEENVKKCGEKFDVKWSTNWDEFISDDELDIVSICTPSGNHLDYGGKAAEAGKHVIIEKPIEITLERANRLIQKCKNNNVHLSVIYQSRFIPEIIEVKKQVNEKIIGNIFMADAYVKWYRSQEYYDSALWRGTFKLDGGGVLINQAIHSIDLMQWFIGDVETVYGKVGIFTHKNIEGEDNAVAVIKFKTGVIGVIEASTSVQPAQSKRIELHGETGTIIISNDVKILKKQNEKNYKTQKENYKNSTGANSPLSGFSIEPHKTQFETIVNSINSNISPPVSGEESLKSLAIVLAIYESSKTNLPINLDEFIKKKII